MSSEDGTDALVSIVLLRKVQPGGTTFVANERRPMRDYIEVHILCMTSWLIILLALLLSGLACQAAALLLASPYR